MLTSLATPAAQDQVVVALPMTTKEVALVEVMVPVVDVANLDISPPTHMTLSTSQKTMAVVGVTHQVVAVVEVEVK